MTTAGPNYAGTIASDSAVGTLAWTNIANMGAADTSYATVAPGSSGTYTSYYAKLTNLDFSLPSNATVNGITVEINRRCDQNGIRYTLDAHVKLIKAGTIGATNKADTTNKWPTSLTVKSYGSDADLWSDTWTYSDINNSGFGVAFSCAVTRAAQGATAYVDYVRVTVTYTVGGTTYTQSVAGSLTATGALTIEARKTTVAGAVNGTGGLARSVGRGVAGSVAGSGAVSRVGRKSLAGSISATGLLNTVKTILLNLVGSVTVVGVVGKRAGKGITGSATAAGLVNRVTGKDLTGLDVVTGTVTKTARKGVTGTSGASGLLGRLTGHSASGAVTATGSTGKTARKGLTGGVTVAGFLAALKSTGMYFVNLAGGLTASGGLTRSIRKGVVGQTSAQGTIAKTTRKSLAGSVTPTGALARLRLLLLSIGGSVVATGSVIKRTIIEASGAIQARGALGKLVNKTVTGFLTALGNLLARLPGGAKRGVVYVNDRALNGLMLVTGACWIVDVTDLAGPRAGLIDRTAYSLTADAQPVYCVTIRDLGGVTI